VADTDIRLQRLEAELDDLRGDLGVLRKLMEQDHGSALNKIRYVTEKVLHQLCVQHDVSWGKSEPTLECMIGPLIASKVIPKNVAIHVRTVQTNASPGSHFQETPLGGTHVAVAQMALLEFLEWHHRTVNPNSVSNRKLEEARKQAEDDAREAAAVSTATPQKPRPKLLVGSAIAGAIAIIALAVWQPWRHAPAPAAVASAAPAASADPAPALKEPAIGLRALDMVRSPKGAQISLLQSESFWESAVADFEVAVKQPGAPVRWRAGHQYAKAAVHMTRGEYDAALVDQHGCGFIEGPRPNEAEPAPHRHGMIG
jgi:hypothetical protein